MNARAGFSWRRLRALSWKETLQILRDPSSLLIAVVIPIVLLLLFGFGISLDTSRLKVGVVLEDNGAQGRSLAQAIAGSPYFDVTEFPSRAETRAAMDAGRLRGYVVIPQDFTRRLMRGESRVPVQVVTDGAEPNTASFLSSYMQGVLQAWMQGRMLDAGREAAPPVDIALRAWFNPSMESRHFLIPGAIAVIMTIIGALLTSLVVAREWERGTMEALLATPLTRLELLLSKIIPYYLLGMTALAICVAVATLTMDVTMRGSLLVLFLPASLFLGSALGLGLLLSTVTRNQFNAAQAALNAAFLPAALLSGFIFEIASMPAWVRAITYVVPARYLVAVLQTLFQAGHVWPLLAVNTLFLLFLALFWLGLTALKTRRRLDG